MQANLHFVQSIVALPIRNTTFSHYRDIQITLESGETFILTVYAENAQSLQIKEFN